ncbi:MAG: phosphatase PAP2 family protein [Pseudomonadota bacterium]
MRPAPITLADRVSRTPLWRATVLLFLLALAWDASGLDRPVMHWLADGGGFSLRHHWLLERMLHDAAHDLSVGLYLALVVMIWLPRGPLRQLTRMQRLEIASGTTLAIVLIGVLKRLSLSSCPWDLAEFGGVAIYVSHWTWGLGDGGPGHCFPGGHVSSAFAFVALALPWLAATEPAQRRHGQLLLWGVLAAGLLLGLTQTLRGAHFPSHTAWTAWLCWTAALVNRQVFAWVRAPADSRTAGAGTLPINTDQINS